MKNLNIYLILISILFFNVKQVKGQEPQVSKAAFFDISEPLRDKVSADHNNAVQVWKNGLVKNYFDLHKLVNPKGKITDLSSVQKENGSKITLGTIHNFAGTGNVLPIAPPDPSGDVGPNHYVQMINSKLQIFDKTGSSIYGPVDNSTLWEGFTGAWTGTNDGDPIVLYDENADRWFLSQFAVKTSNNSYWILIAISTTGDPTGTYYRYAFEFDYMPDYPKYGIWGDGYYVSVNQFEIVKKNEYRKGGGLASLERDAMLAGSPDARMIFFTMLETCPQGWSFMPADCDSNFPPSGTPNVFAYINDDTWGGNDELDLWAFHSDWDNPVNSTITNVKTLPVDAFDSDIYGSTTWENRNNLEQPDVSQKLHAMSDRLMFRMQYRNFGTHQSMVLCHTVDAVGGDGDRAGIRWYELRKSTADWCIHQQSTYAPDDNHRWMGSIAMNGNGDIALGYSIVSSTIYPSIRYTGRLASDPLNTMTIAEQEIVAGTSSQTIFPRWGDYSMMSIDPSNDKTFWYNQEYTSGSFFWKTQIASFNLEELEDPILSVSESGTSQINLSWIKNDASNDVIIAWSLDGNFGKLQDGKIYTENMAIAGGGTVLYIGENNSFSHLGLRPGTTYYYKAWSVKNASPDYSFGVTDIGQTLREIIFYDGFESENGWIYNGEWERGAPQGLNSDSYGAPDPENAYAGTNVLGLDLSSNGDYGEITENRGQWAISPVIDCSGFEYTEISFYRWLGVKDLMDYAYIDISTNGTDWIELWTNTIPVDDGNWYKVKLDISDYADNQSTIQIRFSMGEADDSWYYCGWNIDEFYITGISTLMSPVATIIPEIGCSDNALTVLSSKRGEQTFYLKDEAGDIYASWTGDNISHTFTGITNGTYTAQVEKNGNTSALSESVSIVIENSPVAPTAINSSDTEICLGQTVELSYTGGEGTNFVWYSGSSNGTFIGTGNNLSVTPYETTTFFGKWESFCETSACQEITVNVVESPTATVSADNISFCEGENAELSINLTGVPPWNLTYTDGITSVTVDEITDNPYILNITNEGTYSVINLSDANCTATENDLTGSVTVIQQVITANISVDNISFCEGESAELSINLTGVPPWNLTYTDGTTPVTVDGITDNPYILNITNEGTYSVINLSDANCTALASGLTGSTTVTQLTATVVTEHPDDVVALVGDNISFDVTAEGDNLEYQWRFNEIDIEEANNENYEILNVQPNNVGNYSVVLNGTCGEIESNSALLSISTISIENLTLNGIKVFPNPFYGIINIHVKNDVNLEIIDVSGKILFSKNMNNKEITKVDLTNQKSGFYIMKFTNKNESFYYKLIKK